MPKSQIEQIEQIAGMTKTVTVSGHEITVSEITMRHLAKFTQVCAPFLSAFDEAGDIASKEGAPPQEFALFALLAQNSDAFMQAAAMVTNADAEFYARLKPDEFYTVAAAILEVNGSFFVRRLLPAIVKMAQGIQAVGTVAALTTTAKATGSMPSDGS